MEILGYILAILTGFSLGLIGGGGSILTIPILVYLLGIEASEVAPAYSLFVVGVASLIGVIIKAKNKEVNFKTALLFGIPTVISIFITRKYYVPAIPEVIIDLGIIVLTKRLFIMGIFSIIMIIAAIIMIKGKIKVESKNIAPNKKAILLNFTGGLGIGALTGLVGAGGGFIIIPALIKLANLTMKTAIGTSLAIITMNSFFGFIGSLEHISVNWSLLLIFTTLASIGIVFGAILSKKINGAHLKKGFGWFILVMGIFIIIKETLIQ